MRVLRRRWARLSYLNFAPRYADPPSDLAALLMKKATAQGGGFQSVQSFSAV
jgi:hypothetical protein